MADSELWRRNSSPPGHEPCRRTPRNSKQLCLTQCAEVAMMKNKVEVAANIVVILLAVVIGSVFLMDRFASPSLGPNEVKVGDQLPRLNSFNWKAHDRTLLL